jgi:glycosyltransferase involved in cell wall biosynthesis
MKRIRVLHVVPTLDQSGAEKQLALLAMHLPRDRFETHVCAVTRGGFYEHALRDAGVPVHVVGKRARWDPFCLWRLTQRIREIQPALVQTWMFTGNAYGRVAAKLAGVGRIVASERCIDEWKSGYHFAVDRLLARWTDRFAVNSEGIARFYAKAGVSPDRIRTIRSAVDPRGRPQGVDPAAMRRAIGAPECGPLIGFVGRLWPQKRVQDLIWAADVLRLSGWTFHVVVVGDGPRRAALERFADSLEIRPMVQFLGHRSDAREIIESLDVLVLPSRFEGLPNVVLEAMQSGKPVVATRIAGTSEAVVDGETGILVAPRQPLELARGIRTILADPDLGRRMGRAGQARVEREFRLDSMIQGYAELYEELVAQAS